MTDIDINQPRGVDDTQAQIAVLRAELAALDRLTQDRGHQIDKALALQTDEFQRRLDLLNGEQTRLQQERDRFVGREVFEQFRQEYRTAHEALRNLVIAGETRSREALDGYRREVSVGMKTTDDLLKEHLGRERGMNGTLTFIAMGLGLLVTLSTFFILYLNS